MDATAELTRALAEWRRLTGLEGEAILSDNWKGVTEQQSLKEQLQTEIQRAFASIRAGASHPSHGSGEVERKFVSLASELIALEKRNGELLAAKRNRYLDESRRLALTLRDLHGVRRAYGSSLGLHWQSYS